MCVVFKKSFSRWLQQAYRMWFRYDTVSQQLICTDVFMFILCSESNWYNGCCSLAYTVDGQNLFCATSDCVVHVWTKPTAGRRKQFKFVSYVWWMLCSKWRHCVHVPCLSVCVVLLWCSSWWLVSAYRCCKCLQVSLLQWFSLHIAVCLQTHALCCTVSQSSVHRQLENQEVTRVLWALPEAYVAKPWPWVISVHSQLTVMPFVTSAQT